eukprot:6197969-Pleurochrysis_carterae.AAC.2
MQEQLLPRHIFLVLEAYTWKGSRKVGVARTSATLRKCSSSAYQMKLNNSHICTNYRAHRAT